MTQPEDRTRMNEWLDLLADMVAERIRATAQADALSEPEPEPASPSPVAGLETATLPLAAILELEPASEAPLAADADVGEDDGEAGPAIVPPVGPPHAARLLSRLAMGLLLMVILINIPINCHGTTLATAMPDAQSLAIRDGLVVKVEDAPEIYVYNDGAFHWISSMDAFEHYGYTWADVHIVQEGFLRGFKIGEPIHVLLKCSDSPHVYLLENGAKRWMVDIPTFEAEGFVWERDIKNTTCEALRSLPDGETIPPGHGPAPQP
jgi:hypothetical protein